MNKKQTTNLHKARNICGILGMLVGLGIATKSYAPKNVETIQDQYKVVLESTPERDVLHIKDTVDTNIYIKATNIDAYRNDTIDIISRQHVPQEHPLQNYSKQEITDIYHNLQKNLSR